MRPDPLGIHGRLGSMRPLKWCLTAAIAPLLACPSDDASSSSATTASVTDSSGSSDATAATAEASTSAVTGSEGSSTTAESGSSATTATESTSGDTTAGSTDTGGLGLVPCGPEEPACPAGSFCQMSGCCFDEGVCIPEGTPTCDDSGIDACAEGLGCLQDACVNEQMGACLPSELIDEICMAQSVGCWTICPVP
jgi:hypothetical protein